MRLELSTFIDPALAEHVEEARQENARRGIRRGPGSLAELWEIRRGADRLPDSTLVEAGGRQVPVRLHLPCAVPRGVHLDFHGGGFYLGRTAQDDVRNQRLADALGIVVVSVDHRLAPEHPWPAAPDDAETAALWLLGEERFNALKLTIGGFSAGATLAVTTLLRLKERGAADRFAGAALQFGTYDLSGLTPAGRLIADEYFIQAYAGHAPDRTVPDISPVFGDLRGLPPLLVVVGALDVLLEDNLAMAARAAAVGEVDLRVYPESRHGFTNRDTGMARAARHDVERWLADRLS
ncbi:Acetyl esterase/lipase [Lentzea xinjiangensis]|uniref:Acetyl esterase/lipase n=1 Tax=Lentzea xinjiangensis TaxID=402600 RepID=A0A1H9LUK5_9PSEU|nr:alpha/beta hydrolase fold domain-containing protein [Lentzea xinjiangensis]SER15028.1 Acetyl esterase/lipase [Lentzea xinjiangensis]